MTTAIILIVAQGVVAVLMVLVVRTFGAYTRALHHVAAQNLLVQIDNQRTVDRIERLQADLLTRARESA